MSDVSRILKEARSQSRLTTLDYAEQIFDDFMELHGDRHFADDGAIVGGIGLLDGQAVTVIGVQKGKNLQDNLNRNFGQPNPEGYRKALRLMKHLKDQLSLLSTQQELIRVLELKSAVKEKRLPEIC